MNDAGQYVYYKIEKFLAGMQNPILLRFSRKEILELKIENKNFNYSHPRNLEYGLCKVWGKQIDEDEYNFLKLLQ